MTRSCIRESRRRSNCEDTFPRKFDHLIVKVTCCVPPDPVNLVRVVDTTVSPATLSDGKGIHVSVDVEYLLYLGRYEYRDGDVPETIGPTTGVRTGVRCDSNPSSLFQNFVPLVFPSVGVSICWGLQPMDPFTYLGGLPNL